MVQVFWAADGGRRQPIVGAVGQLQFDVVVARFAAEYRVKTSVQALPFTQARRVDGTPDAIACARWPYCGWMRVLDHDGRMLAHFASRRVADRFTADNPALTVRAV